jgi:lipid A 4'-phosphatase
MKATQGDRSGPKVWRREGVGFAITVAVTTLLFWLTDLDIRVSALFYRPHQPGGPWPYYNEPIWRLLYRSDTFLTIILAAIAITLIALGLAGSGRRRFVRYGVFIALSGLIGAGLLTNAVFKEYWGHPRPDNILRFGGNLTYLPPLAKGTAGNGESFPSGHASIAFSFVSIWFILRGRRPVTARACLAAVLVLTALEGAGRMVRGRHFLSDVLWGAYIPYAVCFILYYFIFRFQDDPDISPPVTKRPGDPYP